LAEIAAAVDVPLGNVRYYVKTKDALIDAVVEAHVEGIEATIVALGGHDGGPTDEAGSRAERTRPRCCRANSPKGYVFVSGLGFHEPDRSNGQKGATKNGSDGRFESPAPCSFGDTWVGFRRSLRRRFLGVTKSTALSFLLVVL
jgi:AcrR family transcriptional regulator